jgi:hypothetical protein
MGEKLNVKKVHNVQKMQSVLSRKICPALQEQNEGEKMKRFEVLGKRERKIICQII